MAHELKFKFGIIDKGNFYDSPNSMLYPDLIINNRINKLILKNNLSHDH